MKSWVKLYTEITRDPKCGSLTWAQRGIWTALLALAGELDVRDEGDRETGEVDTVPNIAWRIRCDEGELQDALTAFEARDMISVVDGIVMVTHYGERQRRPESDRHAAVLERVKRHRSVKRERNAVTVASDDVTSECNEVVTPLHGECNEVVTPLESDTDTDTDTDSEAEKIATAAPCARTEAGPEVVEQGGAPPLRTEKGDARSRDPAILAVKTITGRMPPKGLYDAVIRALSPAYDEDRLRACYEAWLKRGYKVTNFAWLFEWYAKKGIPEERRNGHGPAPGPLVAMGGMSEAQKRLQAIALAGAKEDVDGRAE